MIRRLLACWHRAGQSHLRDHLLGACQRNVVALILLDEERQAFDVTNGTAAVIHASAACTQSRRHTQHFHQVLPRVVLVLFVSRDLHPLGGAQGRAARWSSVNQPT